ncbi:hypothetical protein Ancab_013614 [Ancistrocladus abbreviatus]
MSTVTIGNAGFDFSFVEPNMELIREEEGQGEGEEEVEGAANCKDGGPPSPPMYLAAGLGVDDGESIVENFLESHHPLILRNYAQLLQSKGDYHGAEDYYFRAKVADDGDGEILSQYAKLVWDLHHDQEKASAYFERAAQAAPQDSYVLAAYASFLWEVDSNRDSDSANQAHPQIELKQEGNLCSESNTMTEKAQRSLSPSVCLTEGTGNGIAGLGGNNGKGNLTTEGPSESANIEDYYEMMVEADPSNPLFLRNYAHFLYQCKGDLRGAEEYYSRAILADPQDGEILSKYANLVWELFVRAHISYPHPPDHRDDDEEEVGPVNTVQIAVPGGVDLLMSCKFHTTMVDLAGNSFSVFGQVKLSNLALATGCATQLHLSLFYDFMIYNFRVSLIFRLYWRINFASPSFRKDAMMQYAEFQSYQG